MSTCWLHMLLSPCLSLFIYKTELGIPHRCLEQCLVYNKHTALTLSHYYLGLSPLQLISNSPDDKLWPLWASSATWELGQPTPVPDLFSLSGLHPWFAKILLAILYLLNNNLHVIEVSLGLYKILGIAPKAAYWERLHQEPGFTYSLLHGKKRLSSERSGPQTG